MVAIACHAWAFNDRPLEEAVATIARLGFQYIDLGSGSHLNIDRAATQPGPEAAYIRALLEDYKLKLSDLYILLPYINAPDPKQREEQFNLLERLIPFAIALGTPGITVSPGILHPDGAEHSLARSLPALMRIVEIIEDTDIRLSFEAHMDSPITKPDITLKVLEAIPGLSLTLDYAHFIVQGYKLPDLLPLLPYTAHIHLRQAVKGRLQTPHEQGRLDLAKAWADLQAGNYSGTLTVEYMTTVGWHGMMALNIPQETVKTRDALRQLRSPKNR
jgi:sugar phosphate isomerase/epimerase